MLQLVIGNKNYSSWSLRPWLLLREFGIEFEEIRLRLSTPEFSEQIRRYSTAGRVPVLIDQGLSVWDTLAIAEYVAERFPEHPIWPSERVFRAQARSMCAEMHSGFQALRNQLPMNISANLAGLGWNVAVQRDVDRISQMWSAALSGSGGPFLFGRFGAVDAYFAPVVSRLTTYAIALDAEIERYRDTVLALAGFQEWSAAARLETEIVLDDEPYRIFSER